MTKPRKTPAHPRVTTSTGYTSKPKPIRMVNAPKQRKAKPVDAANPLVRMLPCPLSTAERSERAMQAVETGVAIDTEVALKKRSNELSDKLIKELREKAHSLQQEAVDGVEIQPVQCREELDTDHQNIVLIRCDTDKVVETLRKATAEDANLSLFEDK